MTKKKLIILLSVLAISLSSILNYQTTSINASVTTLFPTFVEAQGNLTGTLSTLQDVIDDTIDSTWMTATDATLNVELYAHMDDPPRALRTGTDLQEMKTLVRKTSAGGGNPTVVLEVYEIVNGTANKITGTSFILGDESQIYTVKFDAASLTDKTGKNLIGRVIGVTPSGSKAVKRSIDVAAVNFVPAMTAIPVPTNFKLSSQTSSSNTLSWDAVTGASGYELKRNGTVIYTGSNLTYTDSSLSSDFYKYELSTMDGSSRSDAAMVVAPLGLEKQTLTLTPSLTNQTVTEDFEMPASPKLPLSYGSPNWISSTTTPYAGVYSMKSNNGNQHNTTASMILSNVKGPGKISFRYRVSSELNYDKFHFLANGVSLFNRSGEVAWTFYEYTIPEGTHTFKWDYVKDVITNSGADSAFVDNIILTTNQGNPVVLSINPGVYYGVHTESQLAEVPFRLSTDGGSTWGTSVKGMDIFNQLTKYSTYNTLRLEHTSSVSGTIDYYYKSASIATPVNFQGTLIGDKQATLSWNAVAGADEYILKRDGTIVYQGTGLSFADTGLTANTTYAYTVQAKNTSSTSDPASLSIKTKLSVPSVTNVNIKPLNNELVWGTVAGATGYKLYRDDVLIYDGTATSYLDTGRTDSKSHVYRLMAYHTTNTSEDRVLTVKNRTLSIVTTPLSDSSIKVEGTSDLTGHSSYTFILERNGSEVTREVKATNATDSPSVFAVTDTGLSANTTYSYKVLMNYVNGGTSYTESIEKNETSLNQAETGELKVTAPALVSGFEDVTIDGQKKTVHAELGAVQLVDSRSSEDSWNLTVESSRFTEQGATGTPLMLPTNSLKLNAVNQITQVTGSSALPVASDYSGNSFIDNGPLTIVTAGVNQGKGTYHIAFTQPTLRLEVDTSKELISSGTQAVYESIITWTITSGP